ncbi:YjdF family protein [Heyndrickxia sporothermodurans]
MHLTIYFDGQFWVGIIETLENNKLKAYRYVFGNEPKDVEVLHFVHHQLQSVIWKHSQSGIDIETKLKQKVNPKRMQRQISKEMKKIGLTTKAHEAIKQELVEKKQHQQAKERKHKEETIQRKYMLKKQKAKQKHRGK